MSRPLRIGVDGGKSIGWAVVDQVTRSLVAWGIETSWPELRATLRPFFASGHVSEVICEAPRLDKPAKSSAVNIEVKSRLFELAESYGIPTREIAPVTVRARVGGRPGATKAQVFYGAKRYLDVSASMTRASHDTDAAGVVVAAMMEDEDGRQDRQRKAG